MNTTGMNGTKVAPSLSEKARAFDPRSVNLIAGILSIALVAPFVMMRLYVRAFVARIFGKEDYACLIAWLFATAYFSTGFFMGAPGDGSKRAESIEVQQAFYAGSILYGPSALFTKLTLLLIFARVFSPFNRTITFIYIFMALMCLYYLPVVLVKTFICRPISGFWAPTPETKCLDQKALFVIDGIMSAITDIIILVLPIYMTWSLNIPLRKKLRIMGLLGAGGLATGASIFRLVLVLKPGAFNEASVELIRLEKRLLGVAEVGIGLICASIPAISTLIGSYKIRQQRSQGYIADVQFSRRRGAAGRVARTLDTDLSTTRTYVASDVLLTTIGKGNDVTGERDSKDVKVVTRCACMAPRSVLDDGRCPTCRHDAQSLWEEPWDGTAGDRGGGTSVKTVGAAK